MSDELQMNLGAFDLVRERSRIITASDDQHDNCPSRAAHEPGHLVKREASDGLAVDTHKNVTCLQAGLLGGSIVVDLDDARLRVLGADTDADADVGVVAARPRL